LFPPLSREENAQKGIKLPDANKKAGPRDLRCRTATINYGEDFTAEE
jgi:hypothetical protein